MYLEEFGGQPGNVWLENLPTSPPHHPPTVLRIEPRASCILSMYSTPGLHPQSFQHDFIVVRVDAGRTAPIDYTARE